MACSYSILSIRLVNSHKTRYARTLHYPPGRGSGSAAPAERRHERASFLCLVPGTSATPGGLTGATARALSLSLAGDLVSMKTLI
jgi:hypothetical protein